MNSVPERSDGTAPKRNPRRPRKPITIVLFAEEWDVLCERARAHERDPYQHARWLLMRGLGLAPDESPAEYDEDEALRAAYKMLAQLGREALAAEQAAAEQDQAQQQPAPPAEGEQ